mmetsp:Transcript_66098/g.215041  ORF Transcript_66098/g.215041 Transcript_66098/m.215041 type:complete len:396 (+) Transcript_66098:589-1776(+)
MPDLLEHLAHLDLHARAHLVRAGCVPSPFEFCLRPDVLLNIVLHVLGLVLQLRREGAVAHARGVRLDHADNGVDLLRRDPQARTNAPDGRVRGRHEWIRAEVDIQQRGIGALDEDLVSSGDVLVDEGHRVDNLTPQDVGKLPVALDLLLDARDAALLAALGVEGGLRVVRHQGLSQLRLLLCVLLPRVAEALLRPSDQLSQPALELLEVQEVTEAEAVADGLRRVARADAALRGADGVRALLRLQDAVDNLVAVKEQMRTGRDEDPLDRPRVEVLEVIQLPHERRHVDHHAVTDQVLAGPIDHAARQQVEGVLLAIHEKGVPGVGAAVKAGAELDVLREDVHELALALIAPLSAEHHAEAGVLPGDSRALHGRHRTSLRRPAGRKRSMGRRALPT